MKELHIYADEDHVHLQKPNKQKGKKIQIVPLVTLTEVQVSHVLSKRFSREPLGWSKTILGKLSKLRVYVKNGGQITGKDFQRVEPRIDRIGEEAKENLGNKLDWSIFDGEPWIFDRNSGTQILLHMIGKAGKDTIC